LHRKDVGLQQLYTKICTGQEKYFYWFVISASCLTLIQMT